MPVFKNVATFGDQDIPLLGRVVEAGEEVDMTPEQVKQLAAGTSENWQRVDKKTTTTKASD